MRSLRRVAPIMRWSRGMSVGEPPRHIVDEAVAVIMPQLSPSMKTGSVERWCKSEGDAVEMGDVLFEVRTEELLEDDGTGNDPGSFLMTIEAHDDGILALAMPVEDMELDVGTCIGMIVETEEEMSEVVEARSGPSCCNGMGLPEAWTGRSLLGDDDVRSMMWQAYLLRHDAPIELKTAAPVGPSSTTA